jgi:hypothetical protein
MTDKELREFGTAAASMCSLKANLGKPPKEAFLVQQVEAKLEWKRRLQKKRPA